MTEDERIVREAWNCEIEILFNHDAKSAFCSARVRPRALFRAFRGPDLMSAWHAAAEFTIQRQEEIRQVKSEVDYQFEDTYTLYLRLLEFIWLGEVKHLVGCTRDLCVSSRILAARQAALAELQRGWKGLK